MKNTWLDVRQCIATNDYYRDARVDWEATQQYISEKVSTRGMTITQGFLGAEGTNNFTTTLGREGSDYTAAVFAYCLNAKSATIWKDVPGVLKCRPEAFQQYAVAQAHLLPGSNRIGILRGIGDSPQDLAAFAAKGNSVIRKIFCQSYRRWDLRRVKELPWIL